MQKSFCCPRRWFLTTIILIALGLLPAAQTHAHPHIWIDALAELMFDDDSRLNGIRVYWVFDELYSAYAVEGLDANGDGKLDPNELAPLAADNVKNLKEYGYFTWLEVDGASPAYGEVTDYGARYVDGRLAMWFRLPLTVPVDPRDAQVAFALYDPTFYTAIELVANDPIRTNGDKPATCGYRITEAKASSDNLSLSESFFDSLDPSSAFGAQFARWVQLTCGSSS